MILFLIQTEVVPLCALLLQLIGGQSDTSLLSNGMGKQEILLPTGKEAGKGTVLFLLHHSTY